MRFFDFFFPLRVLAIEITTKWGNLFWKINFQLISILSRKEKNLPIFVVISNYLLLSNENEFRGGVEVFLRFFFVLIYFEFIISIDSFNLYSLVGFLFDSFLVVNNISSNFYFVHFWCGGVFDGFVIIQSTKKKVSTVPVLISNPSFITVRRNKKKTGRRDMNDGFFIHSNSYLGFPFIMQI
jgi:hypothetical protein